MTSLDSEPFRIEAGKNRLRRKIGRKLLRFSLRLPNSPALFVQFISSFFLELPSELDAMIENFVPETSVRPNSKLAWVPWRKAAMARLAIPADFRLTRDQVTTEGFLGADEGYALLLLAQYGPGAGAVVEIGSFLGRSTCFLALGARRGGREPVFAVDHFGGSPEHQIGQAHQSDVLTTEGTTYGEFQRNLQRAGVSDYVRPIRASSIDAAARWSAPIRLLFIDGDHSYEASRADVQAWSPFVEELGLMVFHDIGSCRRNPIVCRTARDWNLAGMCKGEQSARGPEDR